MSAEEHLVAILDSVRPFVQADGGDLELSHINGSSASLHQTGRCAGCPSARMILLQGVEQALRRAVPEFGDIRFTANGNGPEPRRAGRRDGLAPDPMLARGPQTGEGDPVQGRSTRMRALTDFIKVIHDSDSTVLITGESGTGKEITARTIHRSSRRRARPFVPVSCALFSDTLIESELFGHERGAFTNAIKDRPGRFELAEGGTLFLDDIDDIPLALQVKLLRVLQNRTVERLGGTRLVPVNVRVIAASKHDLKAMVADGRFREDLFYRLNVIPLTLPPLRDRREDIPDLMDTFFECAARRRGEAPLIIPAVVREAFLQYNWPGNVRELENACERIVQSCFCGTVGAGCLTLEMLSPPHPVLQLGLPAASLDGTSLDTPTPIDLDERLRDFELGLLDWALGAADGNKSKAANLLKIRRSTFSDRLDRCRRASSSGQEPSDPVSEASAQTVPEPTPAHSLPLCN